ncbi:MAG: fluoride efflux transporter CrcB [Kangiellaceae bacterium]|jgi:CrcB protein|nr:fluoride efflux transporter CrcB [Kangiellaceae bacterium]
MLVQLNQVIAVALASALGGVARFMIREYASKWFGLAFPYSTLIVNTIGCFTAGVLIVYWQHSHIPSIYKTAVTVGFLGAFTTFSAFSVDTLALYQQQEWLKMTLNITTNLGFSLIAVFFGAWIGGRILAP